MSTPIDIHEFILILSGFSELTDEMADVLYEAGCDDGLPCSRDGVSYIVFGREGRIVEVAILSAIKDVENSGIGARVVRVEPDDIVNASEIARRSGRTRQSIKQLRTGERGPGGFPLSVTGVTHGSPVWHWHEVAKWFVSGNVKTNITMAEVERAKTIALINAALMLRKTKSPDKTGSKLLRQLLRVG